MPRTHRCAGLRARSVSDSATTATRHCLSCLVQLGVAGLGAFVATSVVGSARPVGSEAGRASARPCCADPTPRRRRRLDEVTRVGLTARDAFVAQLRTLSELRPPRAAPLAAGVGVRVRVNRAGLIDRTAGVARPSSRPPRPAACGRPSPALPNYSPRSGFSRGPTPSWPRAAIRPSPQPATCPTSRNAAHRVPLTPESLV
jgi:hypothetical protein